MKDFQKDDDEFNNKTELNISLLGEFNSEDIFQKLPIGIAIIDPATGKFIFINSNFAQILGYTEEELLKKTFQSITHPKDLGKNQEVYEKLRMGEIDSYSIEKRNVRKDGSIVWVNLTAIRLKDKKNRREFHLGAIFDLSVRKLSEQNLKASEELLRTVISNAPISIFATDEKGIFTLHEGKAIERVGMKAGENVGVSAYDLFAGLNVVEHNGMIVTGKSILDRVSTGEYLSGITELNGIVFDNQFAPIWDENSKVVGLLGVATDITDRQQAENLLRDSETYNRMLFDQSVIGLAVARMDGRLVDVNLAFATIVGRTIDEILKLTYWDITPEKYAEQEKKQLDSLHTTGRFGPYEKEYIHQDGHLVPVQLQGVIVEREGQKYIWSSVEDITVRKRMEKERLEFETRYRMLFNEIDEGFCIIEMVFDENQKPIDYCFLEINPAFEKQTGLKDAQGKRMREMVPEHEDYWFEIYGRIALTGVPERFVNRADQLHRWYDVYAFRFGQPEKLQVAILFNDITERKRIQDELHDREEKWHNLFEILPVGVSIVNIQNNTLEINDALSEILDIPNNELISGEYRNRSYFRSDMTPMPPEEFPSLRALEEKKIIRDVEIGIKKEDGSMIWTNVSAAPISSFQDSVTITSDITKHKQALGKIKESEHNLEEAERIGNSGSWDYSVATDTATWSKNMFRIFDVDPTMPKELVFKHFVENLVHPDDRSNVLSVFQDAKDGKRPYDLEYRIVKRDGSIRNIHALAETLSDESGKATHMIGKVEDITERNRMLNSLRESHELFRNTISSLSDAIFLVDPESRLVSDCNEAAEKIFGYTRAEIINQTTLFLHVDKTMYDEFGRRMNLDIEENGFFQTEFKVKRKNGEIFPSEHFIRPLLDKEGKIIMVLSVLRDITDRKKQEEELRYSAEIAANISDGIQLVREDDGIIVHTNRRFEEMFGYDHGELIGKHVAILNAPNSNRNAIETAKTIINSTRDNNKWKGVVQNAKKDGSIFWSQASVTQFEHSSFGKVLITIQMDITEQVQAEMALLENEIRQRAMIANISDVIVIVDRNENIRYKSTNVEKWFGWNAKDLIGKNAFDNIHSEDQDRIKDDFYSLFAEPGKIIHTECRYRCKDNRYKWIELTAVNQIDNPAIDGILVNYHDISQRKKAREKLIRHENELKLLSSELIIAQEKEKKMLAIELHDEIGQALTAMKINLSTVLKNIPAETNNPVCERIKETDQLLDSVLTRVHDISLNLHPAILEILGFAATIKSYSQQFEKRTGIKVRVIDNFKSNLDTEQEINLFRIVQEALTNVAKHANAQNIEIALISGKRWFKLTIKDYGIGFANKKEKISGNHRGIGLIGMNERVNALQGKFRISSSPHKGTKIKIKVPLHGKEK